MSIYTLNDGVRHVVLFHGTALPSTVFLPGTLCHATSAGSKGTVTACGGGAATQPPTRKSPSAVSDFSRLIGNPRLQTFAKYEPIAQLCLVYRGVKTKHFASPVAMDLRQVFATNLRRLRNAKGLSQDDLAYEAEVSRSYLSQLEKGVFHASLKIVGRLAETLGVEPAELLKLPSRRTKR